MEKFVELELHEYMDMYPQKEVRIWEGESVEDIESKAKKFAEYMTKNYSGGTTNFVKVMTKEEATSWYESERDKIKNPDAADELWMTEVVSLIHTCYDTED